MMVSTNGSSDRLPDGSHALNGMFDGTLDGIVDGKSDCTLDGASNVTVDGAFDGEIDGTLDGKSDGMLVDMKDGVGSRVTDGSKDSSLLGLGMIIFLVSFVFFRLFFLLVFFALLDFIFGGFEADDGLGTIVCLVFFVTCF